MPSRYTCLNPGSCDCGRADSGEFCRHWGEPPAATVERFVDARFSASEATQWEQLVAGGMDKDDATAALLSRRGGGTAEWAFEDALLALQELGHADVAEQLRARWADVEASKRYAKPP